MDTGGRVSLVADTRGQAAETMFRGLLESSPDAVVIVDGAGTMQIVNRQTELLFGFPRAELLGRAVELLMPERFRHGHVSHRVAYQADPHTRAMGGELELFG